MQEGSPSSKGWKDFRSLIDDERENEKKSEKKRRISIFRSLIHKQKKFAIELHFVRVMKRGIFRYIAFESITDTSK